MTWLQDANYAQTIGYSHDGKLLWGDAKSWVANLSYFDAVRNVTYTDWRLPSINPLNGVSYNYSYMTDGSTDEGFNISAPNTLYAGSTTSELAYMFYVNLNNQGRFTQGGADSGCYVSPSNTCLGTVGPFSNLQPYVYWSGMENPLHPTNSAWVFQIGEGGQGTSSTENYFYVWAVRDGDVAAIPEPEIYTMFLAAIGLIAFATRLRREP